MGRREGTLENVVKTWQGCRVFLTGHTGFWKRWLREPLASADTLGRAQSQNECESAPATAKNSENESNQVNYLRCKFRVAEALHGRVHRQSNFGDENVCTR